MDLLAVLQHRERCGPEVTVERPRLWRSWLVAGAFAGATALTFVWLSSGGSLSGKAALGPLVLPLFTLWMLWRCFRAYRIRRKGWNSYAIDENDICFVWSNGNSMTIPLAKIATLEMDLKLKVPRVEVNMIDAFGRPRRMPVQLQAFSEWSFAPGSPKHLFSLLRARVQEVNPGVEIDEPVKL